MSGKKKNRKKKLQTENILLAAAILELAEIILEIIKCLIE